MNNKEAWEKGFEITFNLLKLDETREYNLNNWAKGQLKQFISLEIQRAREEERERLREELGDFAHEQYLGCTLENGIWHYSYKNEVVNIVGEYFDQNNNNI